MRRILIAASLASLVITPAAADPRRHHSPRGQRVITPKRDSWYDREVRYRQLDRRITERERLRDRQRDNRARERDWEWDLDRDDDGD